jgi:hypothetical protein
MAEELGYAKRVVFKIGYEGLLINVIKVLDKEKCAKIFPKDKSIYLSETIITYQQPFDLMAKAIGLDTRKIDFAIPESFFDDYYQLFGEKPRIVWSYIDNLFGKPLFYNEVLEKYKALVIEKIMENPDAFI